MSTDCHVESRLKDSLNTRRGTKNLCYYPKGLSNYLFEKDNPLTRKAAPIIQAKQTELALVQFILSKIMRRKCKNIC